MAITHPKSGAVFADVPVAAQVLQGLGTPEGVVTAGVGNIFLRKNGGAVTTLYVKETGTGNTGWVPK